MTPVLKRSKKLQLLSDGGYRGMMRWHDEVVNLECMGQYVAVHQLVQALLQGPQVAKLEVRYAHQDLAKVTEKQLEGGVMQGGCATPHRQ